jgi:OFA family oxalate/formate antiporter-like MFS transporter
MPADGRDPDLPEEAGRSEFSRRWIALAAAVAAAMCAGIGYAWSVFQRPLAAEAGWSTADIALSFTALLGAGAIASIIAGKAQQYVKPRTVILIGGALIGLGLVCLGFVHSLAGVYAFSFLAGLGMGSVYPGGTMTNVIRFFPDRRGMASGILTAGYGVGGVVCAPLAATLIDRYGLTTTLIVLGAFFFAAIALSSRLVYTAPHLDDHEDPLVDVPAVDGDDTVADLDWRGMLRTADFYVLFALFVAGTFSGMMVLGHASPIAQATLGISPQAAGVVVSFVALGMVIGKVGWGSLSDRIGRYPVFAAMLVVAALALVVLAQAGTYLIVVVALATVGLCYGGFLSLMGPVTADAFGQRHLGVNFGIMFLTVAVAAYAGPRLAAQVAEADGGSFSRAFVIAAVINVAALVLVAVHMLLRRRREAVAALEPGC